MEVDMKTYIGVDLGGSNVRAAIVNEQGEVLHVAKQASDGMAGPEVVLKNVFDCIKSLPGWDLCSGIGLGVPGPVDTINGVMTMSTNLLGFTDFPMKATVEKELNMPAFLDNDANVAGLAEALQGAGKGLPIVYYVTISTGIGGALIVNGRVVSGNKGYAGEIGNIIVDRHRKPNFGLNVGALEAEAGGRSLTLKAKAVFGNHIEHAGDIFELVRQHNHEAEEMIELFTEDFAVGLSAIAHVVDPTCFVIGGGMLKSKDVWLEKFKEKFYARIHQGMRTTQIKLAQLEEPGLVGAAMLPVSHGV
jgi:glucokinase